MKGTSYPKYDLPAYRLRGYFVWQNAPRFAMVWTPFQEAFSPFYFERLKCHSKLTVLIGNFQNDSLDRHKTDRRNPTAACTFWRECQIRLNCDLIYIFIERNSFLVLLPSYSSHFLSLTWRFKQLKNSCFTNQRMPTNTWNPLSQPYNIIDIDCKIMRTRHSAAVALEFMCRPEFLNLGDCTSFMERTTKLGMVKVIGY